LVVSAVFKNSALDKTHWYYW